MDGRLINIDFETGLPAFLAFFNFYRFEDQKFRLLRSPGVEKIIYLIEGRESDLLSYNMNSKPPVFGGTSANKWSRTPTHQQRITPEILRGAIASTQFGEGFSILFSDSLVHT